MMFFTDMEWQYIQLLMDYIAWEGDDNETIKEYRINKDDYHFCFTSESEEDFVRLIERRKNDTWANIVEEFCKQKEELEQKKMELSLRVKAIKGDI